MNNKTKEDTIRRSFSDEELSKAAKLVREAMLSALPEPAECQREFSEGFQAKMDKLF